MALNALTLPIRSAPMLFAAQHARHPTSALVSGGDSRPRPLQDDRRAAFTRQVQRGDAYSAKLAAELALSCERYADHTFASTLHRIEGANRPVSVKAKQKAVAEQQRTELHWIRPRGAEHGSRARATRLSQRRSTCLCVVHTRRCIAAGAHCTRPGGGRAPGPRRAPGGRGLFRATRRLYGEHNVRPGGRPLRHEEHHQGRFLPGGLRVRGRLWTVQSSRDRTMCRRGVVRRRQSWRPVSRLRLPAGRRG
jgi:hypothetical protein